VVKKNVLKPWRKSMWCIGRINAQYRERMYALCDLYARAHDPDEPVVCVDEKSKQVLAASRPDIPARPGLGGHDARQDYEYARRGRRNIFMAVEPKGARREVQVSARRTKIDFVNFICGLLDGIYATVRKVHLVVDNLNTHFPKCFVEVLGPDRACEVLRRIEFHHTPKHASWLNMAELEIGIMERQCTGRRFESKEELIEELAHWQQERNELNIGINWGFSRQDADRKLSRHYVA
jgi:hypothetical protein